MYKMFWGLTVASKFNKRQSVREFIDEINHNGKYKAINIDNKNMFIMTDSSHVHTSKQKKDTLN